MANNFGQELGSLDFDNIIGGPLTAVVEAQAHAAETSIDFINEIGLEMVEGETRPITTTFSYQKRSVGEDGNVRMRTHSLRIPVLSIVPIPFISFNDVWLDFNVNLNSVDTRTHKSSTGGYFALSASKGGFRFAGHVAGSKHKRGVGQVSKNYSMGVKIHAVQDEMPEGMERVLNILEQLATAEVKPYNAVKQLLLSLNTASSNWPQNVDVTGTSAIKTDGYEWVGGSGYGSTTTKMLSLPSSARAGTNPTNKVDVMQSRLNATGFTDFDGNTLLVDDKFGRKTAQACWKLAIEHSIGKTKLNDVILGKPGGSTPAVGDGTEPSVFWKNTSPKGWKDTKFLKDPGSANTAAGATTGAATNTGYTWLKGGAYTYAAMNGFGAEITNIVNKLDDLYESSLPSSPAQIRLTIPADGSAHSLSVVDGGSGYADTTQDMPLETDDVQPLTVTANITVVGGIVTQVSNPGPLPSGIVTSTFTDVPLISTSGMGVGASATLTVDGDSIGTCNMTSYGGGFTIGEVLVIDSYHQLAANGNGFQVTVTGVAQQEALKETVYICEGIGGDGSGLKVRVTQDVNGGFGQITPSAIVDGGRDYTKDQIVVLSNSDGSGTIEAIIKEVE